MELAGTQGVELLMWLAARGALPGHVRKVHSQLPHPDLEHGVGVDGDGAGRLSRPPYGAGRTAASASASGSTSSAR